MSEKEKTAVLEVFKNLPKDVQMAVIAGKTLAELEHSTENKPQSTK